MDAKFSLDDFELYQVARALRKKLYLVVKALPVQERYCLGSQMRRAAVSITNNIAEGHGRWHYQENIQFLRFSRGSVEESIDDLNTCIDESYYHVETLLALKQESYDLIRRINGYIAYLKRCKQGDNS